MMGPCTDQSRKSIHCMGRKRRLFAHFALKNLLTERSSGTITHSSAVLKSNDVRGGGRGLPARCPRFTSACWRLEPVNHPLVAQETRWASQPPPIPISSHLHSYWANCKSPPLHHPLFLWQCSADNLRRGGLLWVDVCIWWRRGFHPFQGKKTLLASISYNKAPSSKEKLLFCIRTLPGHLCYLFSCTGVTTLSHLIPMFTHRGS